MHDRPNNNTRLHVLGAQGAILRLSLVRLASPCPTRPTSSSAMTECDEWELLQEWSGEFALLDPAAFGGEGEDDDFAGSSESAACDEELYDGDFDSSPQPASSPVALVENIALIRSITAEDLGLIEEITPTFAKFLQSRPKDQRRALTKRRKDLIAAIDATPQRDLNRAVDRCIVSQSGEEAIQVLRKVRRRSKNATYRRDSCTRKTRTFKSTVGQMALLESELEDAHREIASLRRALAVRDRALAARSGIP
jgi:hypothetical protein